MRTSSFLSTSEGLKYLLCDGSEIPSSYTKLRSLMTHTPDLRDRVPQGAGAYAINTSIDPALPNITGTFGLIHSSKVGNKATGAFSISYHTNVAGRPTSPAVSEYDWLNISIDSSLSSNIYKNDCTTVQPPAFAVNFYIKAK